MDNLYNMTHVELAISIVFSILGALVCAALGSWCTILTMARRRRKRRREQEQVQPAVELDRQTEAWITSRNDAPESVFKVAELDPHPGKQLLPGPASDVQQPQGAYIHELASSSCLSINGIWQGPGPATILPVTTFDDMSVPSLNIEDESASPSSPSQLHLTPSPVRKANKCREPEFIMITTSSQQLPTSQIDSHRTE